MTPAKLTLIVPLLGQESTMVAPLLTPPPPHPQTTSSAHAPCCRVRMDSWEIPYCMVERSQMVDGQFLTGGTVMAVGQFSYYMNDRQSGNSLLVERSQ